MKSANNVLISRIIIVVFLVLLIPWKSQIAPAWKITVVDENGNPIPALSVSQNWVDPNFEGWWLEEDFRTDENGLVDFPECGTWRNLLLKAASPIWNRVLFGKRNYDAMAFGWGSYTRGEAYYRSGQPTPKKLVMYR